jgi:pSer/pThr/pTyr-binding forkhead associated (FHA) protein
MTERALTGPHASTPSELKERLEAERRGTPFLLFRDDAGRQRIVELEGGGPLTVGRRPENDVALPWDHEVSRVHAQLELVGREWSLVDDGISRNGSYVNGERVAGKRRLRDGDRLCFGSTLVAFRAPAQSEFESTIGPPTELNINLSESQHKVLVALARPLAESAFATPATNRAIADELCLSVDAVKAQLRVLFERFDLSDLPQNEKRARLAATALLNGIVLPREL